MKTTITLLLLAFFSMGVYAQYELPADFETPEEDTAWVQFANADDSAENLGLAENPAKDGINTSDNSLKFTVLDNADPWAGAWSEAYGSLGFTAEKYTLEMMVYKDVISDCGLKVEGGGDAVEVKVPNTKTNEWELLTFDFTAAIGTTHPRLVFFPDFPDPRTAGSTCYIDNIGWAGTTSVGVMKVADISVYPNPATELITIRYSDMSSVTISNVLGQTVRSFEFQTTDHEVIEVSDLETGLYFIILETADGMVSSKFVKE
ncbi:MAG: T9SS type A sorting domain-containing protein [Bacteroidales bacterium]|nr:T9SS type A sorting domain-containing protein [Bacteroidales bacterium]